MKKVITLFTTLALLLSLLAIGASAEEKSTSVQTTLDTAYVTVSVKGALVAVQVPVVLDDYDNDGALTVNDALYGLHEKSYEGGAAAGYASYQSDYGLSMSKLWGDESGAFGYYLNNASCMSLVDPVKDGDHVTAFVYASSNWSDVYTYFDIPSATCEPDGEITLTLMAAGYDENWNPITYPVSGATLTVDGTKIGFVTDAEGKVTFSPEAAGTHVFSAVHDQMTIVPPVCTVTVNKPEGGCNAVAFSATGLATLLGLVTCAMIKRKES